MKTVELFQDLAQNGSVIEMKWKSGLERAQEIIAEEQELDKIVVLLPVAMAYPTKDHIYSLSEYQKPIQITKRELKTYNATQMKISPKEKLLEEIRAKKKPTYKTVTAYGKGLSCWYIVAEDK